MGHDHEASGFLLISRKDGVFFQVLEKIVRERLLGTDSLLRQVSQHLQQQVQEIDTVRHTSEVILEVHPLETSKGVKQTGVEGHPLLVLLLLLT